MSNTKAGIPVLKLEDIAQWLKDNPNALKNYIDVGDVGGASAIIVNVGPGYGAPVGSHLLHAGDTPPAGYLVEDGTEKDIATYPALFGVIGHKYAPRQDDLLFHIPMDDTNGLYDLAGNGRWVKAINFMNTDTSINQSSITIPATGNNFFVPGDGLVTDTAKFGTKSFKATKSNDPSTATYGDATFLGGKFNGNFPSREFTIQGWFFPGPISAQSGTIFQILRSPTNPDSTVTALKISVKSNSRIGLTCNDFGGTFIDFTSVNNTLIDAAWNHIAFCYDGHTYRLYVNGVVVYKYAATNLIYESSAVRSRSMYNQFFDPLKTALEGNGDSMCYYWGSPPGKAQHGKHSCTGYFQDWQMWKKDLYAVKATSSVTPGTTTLFGNGQTDSFGVPYMDRYSLNKTSTTTTSPNNLVHSRFNSIPLARDFSTKLSMVVPANSNQHFGFIFRTTNWQAGEGTYGYSVTLGLNNISVNKGTNSATTTVEQLATAAHGYLPGDLVTITVSAVDSRIMVQWSKKNEPYNLRDIVVVNTAHDNISGFGFLLKTTAGPGIYTASISSDFEITTYGNFAVPTSKSPWQKSATAGKFFLPQGSQMFYRGVIPGFQRPIGQVEDHCIVNHDHEQVIPQGSGSNTWQAWNIVTNGTSLSDSGVRTWGTGGEETRPTNLAALPCIKYTDAAEQIIIPDNTELGDVKYNPSATAQPGWVRVSPTATIGNAASGATERANADTQSLFEFLWNSFADIDCPVSGGRGASANADFTANKTILLPQYTAPDAFLKVFIKL